MSWLTNKFKEGKAAVLFDEIGELSFHTTINEKYSIKTQIIQDSYKDKQWTIRLI